MIHVYCGFPTHLHNDLVYAPNVMNSIACITSMSDTSALCWDMGWMLAQHGYRSISKRQESCVTQTMVIFNRSEIQVTAQLNTQLFVEVVQITLTKWKSSAFYEVMRWHFSGVIRVIDKCVRTNAESYQDSVYLKLLKSVHFWLSYTKITGRVAFFSETQCGCSYA